MSHNVVFEKSAVKDDLGCRRLGLLSETKLDSHQQPLWIVYHFQGNLQIIAFILGLGLLDFFVEFCSVLCRRHELSDGGIGFWTVVFEGGAPRWRDFVAQEDAGQISRLAVEHFAALDALDQLFQAVTRSL